METISEIAALARISSPATALILVLSMSFGSVFLLSLTVLRVFWSRAEIRRRATSASVGAPIGQAALQQKEGLRASEMLASVGKWLSPTDVKSYSAARKDMVRAGFFSPQAVPVYHATRLLLSIGLPIGFLILMNFVPLDLPSAAITVIAVLLLGLGFVAPSFYLRSRQKRMKVQYRGGFPDFMDLLVVCVEAGLALQPAISRISRELASTVPQFAANLHLVGLEMRAGSSLTDALDGLTQRLDIDEAISLASLLKQSEELGTSLSTALRVYSAEMRDKRMMRAEEMAHALPVKITLPVGFCIFPVILVIVFLPLIVRIKQMLLN